MSPETTLAVFGKELQTLYRDITRIEGKFDTHIRLLEDRLLKNEERSHQLQWELLQWKNRLYGVGVTIIALWTVSTFLLSWLVN